MLNVSDNLLGKEIKSLAKEVNRFLDLDLKAWSSYASERREFRRVLFKLM